MISAKVELDVAFEILFGSDQLLEEYNRRHRDSVTRGLDRRNGRSMVDRIEDEVINISEKCLSGRYRFTPVSREIEN
ncbi:hypothetical protein [Luteimonas deserti]|uniref:Uncharacterized protein n=1 Tax=Luteimonas deserti TaxID=2752306 RepID=A0A7Z0U0D7_9GAMM|nr:hypothetical protein [Luteimonas deserti]NYZ63173.1 hypothetical protein [Luteimonas deserti]